jgi:hypothetical protein
LVTRQRASTTAPKRLADRPPAKYGNSGSPIAQGHAFSQNSINALSPRKPGPFVLAALRLQNWPMAAMSQRLLDLAGSPEFRPRASLFSSPVRVIVFSPVRIRHVSESRCRAGNERQFLA